MQKLNKLNLIRKEIEIGSKYRVVKNISGMKIKDRKYEVIYKDDELFIGETKKGIKESFTYKCILCKDITIYRDEEKEDILYQLRNKQRTITNKIKAADVLYRKAKKEIDILNKKEQEKQTDKQLEDFLIKNQHMLVKDQVEALYKIGIGKAKFWKMRNRLIEEGKVKSKLNRWTKEEEQYLINNIDKSSRKEIADALNRNHSVISRKIRELKTKGILKEEC